MLTEVDEHFVSIENAKDEDALAFSDLFLLAATVAEEAMGLDYGGNLLRHHRLPYSIAILDALQNFA